VFLPDDLVDAPTPCVRQLMDVWDGTGKSVIALMNVRREDVSSYGIAAGPRDVQQPRLLLIDTLVEKPPVDEAPSTLAVVGRYVLDPVVFQHLRQTNPGRGDEIQLTDALARMISLEGIVGWEFDGSRFDAGDVAGYLLANLNWARKQPRLWRTIKAWVEAHA
jgi:UTP--glucose-1-phosphate uridylyltransferase